MILFLMFLNHKLENVAMILWKVKNNNKHLK